MMLHMNFITILFIKYSIRLKPQNFIGSNTARGIPVLRYFRLPYIPPLRNLVLQERIELPVSGLQIRRIASNASGAKLLKRMHCPQRPESISCQFKTTMHSSKKSVTFVWDSNPTFPARTASVLVH